MIATRVAVASIAYVPFRAQPGQKECRWQNGKVLNGSMIEYVGRLRLVTQALKTYQHCYQS